MTKTVAFFPEAAFGPALNSVGIAQALKERGHKPVFLSDPGFLDVYKSYGFKAYPVNLSEPMAPEEMAKFWAEFINGHIPNFRKKPIDQLGNYVKDCWAAIVDSAKWAEKDLPKVLKKIKPDLVAIDNVVLFPAIKRYAEENGIPWVRIISCSENEIEDPAIPPHLSGCGADDIACHKAFRKKFERVIKPIHKDFNAFLKECGEEPYPLGQFFEASPHLNLLLYPKPVAFQRRIPLNGDRFRYLEGCVRQEEPFEVPDFGEERAGWPLVYVSYGSLGAGDVDLVKRVIMALGKMEVRALVNVGDYEDQYNLKALPPNVKIASWYPQPSVIPQVDAVIHHGGNNSFTECLYFGKPAIVMPFVWDGHDNAQRAQETGHGVRLDRYKWTEEEFAETLNSLLDNRAMHNRLKQTSAHMRAAKGTETAAAALEELMGVTE